MAKYSVLLLYPDADNAETYYQWVDAANPHEAAQKARREAVDPGSYCEVLTEEDIQNLMDEFALLGVWLGHHDLLLGVYDGV